MIARLKLFFPYLCMLPIVALLLWGFGKQSIVKADDPKTSTVEDAKKDSSADCCEGEKSPTGQEIDYVCGMEVSLDIY
ncbi:MAG: hypothetical protein P1V97_24935 [Planctomycetota bacterium]|nr:hypothetical protein [Planctomycetota bacterium]